MKTKPKETLLNLPIVLMFDSSNDSALFAANINTLIHGKIKVKYEDLGQLGDQIAAIFYFQRNDEYHSLREEFVNLIEQEEMSGNVIWPNGELPDQNGGPDDGCTC